MNVKIWYDVAMKMRDGIILYGDVYRPDDDEKYPVILNRTPYNKENNPHIIDGYIHAVKLASYGYNVIIQDVRGTGKSEGILDPAGNQMEDGYDSVEWAAAQEWSDGNVGMAGESYHGFSQLSAAQTRPPHLKAICPFQTSWTKFPASPSFGVFSSAMLGWIYGEAITREKYYPGTLSDGTKEEMEKNVRDRERQHMWLPLKDMPAANIEEIPGLRALTELLGHIDDEAYLRSIGRADAFEQVTVPCLNLTGWADFLRDTTIYNYLGFRDRGGSALCRKESRLIVGPWSHGHALSGTIDGIDFGPEGSGDGFGITEILADWFDCWLKGKETAYVKGAPVKLFILGENKWRDETKWPLERTTYTSYYLHSQGQANTLWGDGALSTVPPEAEPADCYLYDPMNPCPGFVPMPGRTLLSDMSPLEKRADVLVYTAEPFSEAVEITGPIQVELFCSTDAVDTDFVCKLHIVCPDGMVYQVGSQLIRCRYRNGKRAELLSPNERIRLHFEVGNIAVSLQPGYALRLDITSSQFPDADRNLNTGERTGYTADYCVAKQTIYHDREHPSRVILPFICE